MKKHSPPPSDDREIEARIVALVLGEASDFEREELERLISERPELAAFRDEIAGVDDLMREVGSGDWPSTKELAEDGNVESDWKLPAKKRRVVESTLRGEKVVGSKRKSLIEIKDELPWGFLLTKYTVGIAASILLMGFVGVWSLLNAVTEHKSYSEVAAFKSAEPSNRTWAAGQSVGGMLAEAADSEQSIAPMENASSSWGRFAGEDDAALPDMAEAEVYYESNAEFDSAMDGAADDVERYSRSSLAQLQKSLNYSVQVPDDNGDGDRGQQLSDPQVSSGPQIATGSIAPKRGAELSMPLGVNEKFNAPTQHYFGGAIASDGAVNGGNGEAMGMGDGSGFGGVGGGMGGGGFGGGGRAKMGEPAAPMSRSSAPAGGLGMDMGGAAGMSMDAPAAPEPSAPAFAAPAAEAPMDKGAMRDLADSPFHEQPIPAPDASPGPVTAAVMPPVVSNELSIPNAAVKMVERSPSEKAHATEAEDLFGDIPQSQRRSVSDFAKQEAKKKLESRYGGQQARGQTAQSRTRAADTNGQVAGKEIGGEKAAKEEAARQSGGERESINGAAPSIPNSNLWSTLQSPRFDANDGRASRLDSIREITADEKAEASDFGIQNSIKDLDAKIFELKDSESDLSRQVDDDLVAGDLVFPAEPPATADGTIAAGEGRNGWRYQPGATANKRYAEDLRQNNKKLPERFRNGVQEYYKNLDGKGLKEADEPWDAADAENLFLDYRGKVSLGRKIKGKAVVKGMDEKSAADEAFSTFSLHVSDVSFKLALAALSRGEWPETAKIRIEEFVNAMDYGDPMPSHQQRVACQTEQAVHPFLQQRNLLRVSMRTAASGRASSTPLRLTFLIDNSGSMDRIDRKQIVRRAFQTLAGQLKAGDQVTLVTFARQPRLLADRVDGAKADQLVELIDNLPSQGGTNIEAALALAFEKAREQQLASAQNRIILLTDGAVNLGDADPESLAHMITTIRGAGIAFDAAGISAEGLNDEVLEALTRKGDGRYYLLDSVESADENFANQIAGAFRPAAKNVKVQVEFNPNRVGQYKLLGFEKHRLKKEDFRNDKVDAAEMAAAEAGVAVYQFEAKPDGEGDVGTVSVRFRDLSSGQMVEQTWPIPYLASAPRADQAEVSMRIATAAAMLAAKLRGEAIGQAVDLKALSNLIATLPEQDRQVEAVAQLQFMIQQARQLAP